MILRSVRTRLLLLSLVPGLLGLVVAGCPFLVDPGGGGNDSSSYVEFSVLEHPDEGDYTYSAEVACAYFDADDYFSIQACESAGCDEGLYDSDMWNTIGIGAQGVMDLQELNDQSADLVWFAGVWGTLGAGSCTVTVEDDEFESTGTFDCDWGVTYSEVDENGELGPADGDVEVYGSFSCP